LQAENRVATLGDETVGDQRRGGDDDARDAEAQQCTAQKDRKKRVEQIPTALGDGGGSDRTDQQSLSAVSVGDDPRQRTAETDTERRDRDEKRDFAVSAKWASIAGNAGETAVVEIAVIVLASSKVQTRTWESDTVESVI
jgi:hypothetical protein